MFQSNDRDGTSRKKRLEEIQINHPFRVMEDDFFHLFERIQENAAFIRYFNSRNVPSGYWKTLYEFQPLVILLEIRLYDSGKKEQEFLNAKTDAERHHIVVEIESLLKRWEDRLKDSLFSPSLLYSYLTQQGTYRAKDRNVYNSINETAGISESRQKTNEEESDKSAFYNAKNQICAIQQNYDLYWNDLVSTADTDPSVAVILAFIKNYAEITSRFNKRWEKLPEFYLDKILHVRPRDFQSWTTWLVLEPDETAEAVFIPARTGFIAGKQSDQTPILYRSDTDCYMSQMRLQKVLSYYFDEILMQKDLSACIHPKAAFEEKPRNLFYGTEEVNPVSAGILLASSLFWLEAGERHIFIRFELNNLELPDKSQNSDAEKLPVPEKLNDSFCPEISTAEGWRTIQDYTITYQKASDSLNFHLFLPVDFPSAIACTELEDFKSLYPAVRFLMNPLAVCYPYKWMMENCVKRIRIQVEVSGITQIEIQTSMGPADASQPFFPFGPMPEQGGWMSWKNEEMARKKVKEVKLDCKWLQLPVSDEGFYGIYKTYTPPLDNSSFRIQKEYSAWNKWEPESPDKCDLFSYTDPQGKVRKESTFSWSLIDADNFDGIFRMVLTDPAIGFGYSTFQKIFNDCVIQNSFNKKKRLPPEIPVTPLMELSGISYTASEEIGVDCEKSQSTAFYYIHPSLEEDYKKVDWGEPPVLFEGVPNRRNILFGMSQAVGETVVRLFVNIALFYRTLKRSDLFRITWFVKKGPFNWYRLPSERVYRDTTLQFWQTGVIELNLGEPVVEDWVDASGLWWLCAAFSDETQLSDLSPAVFGFYTNPLQVTLDTEMPGFDKKQYPHAIPSGTIQDSEEVLPGIKSISQIVEAYGGAQEESTEELKVRIANQIKHRNRAVTKHDYENLAVGNFKEIGKAYCLYSREEIMKNHEPDTTRVTLVVTPAVYLKDMYPLCDNSLLWRVEDFIQLHTSPFIKIHVRNPFYEEVTVRCHVNLVSGDVPWGILKREIKERIDRCIAPWLENQEDPVFNYSFGVYDMKNEIGNSDYVLAVTNLVILHRHSDGMNRYVLDEWDMEDHTKRIQASLSGNILFPGKNHLIYTSEIPEDEWVGINELEIGNTFIMK